MQACTAVKESSPKHTQSTLHSTQDRLSLQPFLEFGQAHVPGLFRKSAEFSLLEFAEESVLAVGAFRRSFFPMFTVSGVTEVVTEYEMVFSNIITVTHADQEFKLLIPADGSYDPAGRTGSSFDSEEVTPLQHTFLVMFSCIQLNAALAGVSEADLDAILLTLKV